ncbi:RAD51-associated protein 1 isoform X2 [Pithys albifrons albifrons]|uniref:RAD51-associated protein 1 isoform X2 n=1 Tax=Pithys albifrons albifrons TaxID=3385563 RepID=UPI003A5CAC0D
MARPGRRKGIGSCLSGGSRRVAVSGAGTEWEPGPGAVRPWDREMALAGRNRKVVDYSEFGNLEDDDEDFAPSSKKSRTQSKEQKEKKGKQKKPPKEVTPSQTQTPSKRLSLDDKLYKRDLEVALALSVKEKPADILEVQNSEEQGLNQVMDEDTPKADGGQRTVTSKVPAQQKVVDSDDREHDSDSEPESVPTPSGSGNTSGKYVAVKSPTHCLRLGLSRLARVKPLHPSATSS